MFRSILIATILVLTSPPAFAFDINFSWAGLKLCTSGKPNRVGSPAFAVSDVPEGTKYIRFKLVDLNVPNYSHGGGVVKYSGQSTIPKGAFKYKSPCPPNGTHNYQWQATAQTKKNGGKIATATKVRAYP